MNATRPSSRIRFTTTIDGLSHLPNGESETSRARSTVVTSDRRLTSSNRDVSSIPLDRRNVSNDQGIHTSRNSLLEGAWGCIRAHKTLITGGILVGSVVLIAPLFGGGEVISHLQILRR